MAACSATLMSVLREAEATRHLYLSHFHLAEIPPQVFALTTLRRLDLSCNELRSLPASIGRLTALEELWLQGNPLESIDPAVSNLRQLRVLDLRETRLRALPAEVSRLPQLVVLDLAGTDLGPDLQDALEHGGPAALISRLGREDERLDLRDKLLEKLRRGIYAESSDTAAGAASIEHVVGAVLDEFPDSNELRSVIRNAERLFPRELARATAGTVRRRFVEVARSNQRKQLGAELELRLRAVYFDRIDPAQVRFPEVGLDYVFGGGRAMESSGEDP